MPKTFTLLFSGALSLTLLPASAQDAALPAAPAPVAPAASFTATDTVRAIHNLYARRRTGGVIWTIVASAFTARIVTAWAIEGFRNPGGALLGVAVLGGGPGSIGLGKLSRFSSSQEAVVISTYQRSHLLPAPIRRRLRRRHFTS